MEKCTLETLEQQVKEFYKKFNACPQNSGNFIFWGGNDAPYNDSSRKLQSCWSSVKKSGDVFEDESKK